MPDKASDMGPGAVLPHCSGHEKSEVPFVRGQDKAQRQDEGRHTTLALQVLQCVHDAQL